MSRAKNSDAEHDRFVTIEAHTFDVVYRRLTQKHRFPRGYQRQLIEVINEVGTKIKEIEPTFTAYTKTRIAQTVLAAIIRRILTEGQNRFTMPQPARAHWNFVMTGQAADQASYNVQQPAFNIPQAPSNGPQSSFNVGQAPFNMPQAPFNVPQAPFNVPQAPFNLPQAPFNVPQAPLNIPQVNNAQHDNGGMGQSTNTTGVVRSAPNTQQAFTSPDDLDISAFMMDFGDALADRGGQPARGQGQLDLGQADDGQADDGQADDGQQGASSEVNIAELMGGLEKKLKDDRTKQGTSSSSAAGKRRRQA